MRLDEAIEFYKEKAENYRNLIIVEIEDDEGCREFYYPEYEERAKEYEQLVFWLEELVELRKFKECVFLLNKLKENEKNG